MDGASLSTTGKSAINGVTVAGRTILASPHFKPVFDFQFRINMFAVRQCLRIILDSVVAPCISELGLILSRIRIEHKNYQEVHRI